MRATVTPGGSPGARNSTLPTHRTYVEHVRRRLPGLSGKQARRLVADYLSRAERPNPVAAVAYCRDAFGPSWHMLHGFDPTAQTAVRNVTGGDA